MTDQPNPQGNGEQTNARFPELDQLQQEITRRLKDNQNFLDNFMDEDFPDDEVEDEEPEPPEL